MGGTFCWPFDNNNNNDVNDNDGDNDYLYMVGSEGGIWTKKSSNSLTQCVAHCKIKIVDHHKAWLQILKIIDHDQHDDSMCGTL